MELDFRVGVHEVLQPDGWSLWAIRLSASVNGVARSNVNPLSYSPGVQPFDSSFTTQGRGACYWALPWVAAKEKAIIHVASRE